MTRQPVQTVGGAMLRRPTVHPADLTVVDARAVFERSPKTHLLLLVRDGVLVTTVDRDDIAPDAEPTVPAATYGRLDGRTVRADAVLTETREVMLCHGRRRLAVVDSSMRLLGLLCLKRSLSGFCTDDGVAAMRHARGVRLAG